METNCQYISYDSTGFFSKMMVDYVNGDEKLQPYYNYPVSIEGIKASINSRKKYATPRELLVQELRSQYKDLNLSEQQEVNLQRLLNDNTFTVCTAHQANIFTGPLYFIYKIIHTIKLADNLNQQIPDSKFVPVFYMGSEDADLDELGHANIAGEKLTWTTDQTGAVGRMKVDKQFIQLIDRIAGEIEVLPFGHDLVNIFKNAYQQEDAIQQSTLKMLHALFNQFGLLVLIPDNSELKRHFNAVVKKELIEQFSHPLVEKTSAGLSEHYKVQASGREINLFYLTETRRERIEKINDSFVVESLGFSWTKDEILTELENHPEAFSANVILRGVFQESILPNIAFIGGGGEIAYWLELKRVFEACNVPYPMLIVRNSFLLISKEQNESANKLGFSTTDLFQSTENLLKQLVKRDSQLQLNLEQEKAQMALLYEAIETATDQIDLTLSQHTQALQKQSLKKISTLEKKMLRAEKRKFEAQHRQISTLKNRLFPKDSLQERQENFSLFYAKHGNDLLQKLYDASLSLEQQFGLLEVE